MRPSRQASPSPARHRPGGWSAHPGRWHSYFTPKCLLRTGELEPGGAGENAAVHNGLIASIAPNDYQTFFGDAVDQAGCDRLIQCRWPDFPNLNHHSVSRSYGIGGGISLGPQIQNDP